MQKNIWKIDKVLGIRIETVSKLTLEHGINGVRAVPFFYLAI